MSTLDRRLQQVEVVAQQRQQGASLYYDVSALSSMECYELDTLLARAGAAHPTETWANEPLTAAEEERSIALAARVRLVERGQS
jgi:hypothetical protein